MSLDQNQLAIVIPYYNAAGQIEGVIEKAKGYAGLIIVVDDHSPEPLPPSIASQDSVKVIQTPRNLGVGGATKHGIQYALENSTTNIFIKLDADDQMDVAYIPKLVTPILEEEFQFAKGNRFRDFRALRKMPFPRRFGNLGLSFLSKVATGYWNCFDFNNGFFAIHRRVCEGIIFENVANNYFFETSLISELYFQKAAIKEIPMPAIYGDEKSNMKLFKMPFLFATNLFKKFLGRIWKAYYVYDFNIGTIYLTFGTLFLAAGILYGGYQWIIHASRDALTPLGTIMLSTLLIILGFQLFLQAIQFDILQTPKTKQGD